MKPFKNSIIVYKHRDMYDCVECDYQTSRRRDFIKHEKTIKHRRNCGIDVEGCFNCDTCGRVFQYRSGLSRHKRKCNSAIVPKTEKNEDIRELKMMCKQIMHENKILNDKVTAIADKPSIVHNKNINIIQFLNNDCKDALNLSDFIKQIVITFDDLMHIYDKGYIEGIKNTLIKKLIMMEETKRPIHCTDYKRKRFYVKDDDIWERDHQNQKIFNALRDINTKQLTTLYQWQEQQGDGGDIWNMSEKTQHKFIDLSNECTSLYSDHGDKLKHKIITELSNNTVIEKK